MASFEQVLDQLRDNQPQGKYGIAFEKLMVNFFRMAPTLAEQFDEVSRWGDWRYNGGKPDTGIDIVAKRKEDGSWVAIQAKFYQESTSIQKRHIDSFFEASGQSFETEQGREHFSHRYIISTTDKWSKNAEEALANQMIPTSRIGRADISGAPVDWDVVFPGSEIEVKLTRKEPFKPRKHQAEAIEKALEGFNAHDRGKLIMACGTGKTFTSLRLAEQFAHKNGGRARVLFLVPSIALLSQTLREWTAQATVSMRSFAVCSDTKAGRQAEDIASYDVEIPVSTDGKTLAEAFETGKRSKGLHVVFSTYQSLPAVHEAQQQGLADFDLVICDEAHRTTGVTLAGQDASNFVKVHDPAYIKAEKRLYMTATPRLFDDTVKGKAADHFAELASMDDEAIYGPEFHRLGFGEAVERGLLTDYKVLVMTVDESVAAEALAHSPSELLNLTTASAIIGAWNALAKRSGTLQGKKGGFGADDQPMRRTVAFAKDIKHSRQIAESFPALIAAHQELLHQNAVNVEPSLVDATLHHVDLSVTAQHVDGTMNALERSGKITWLEADFPSDESRVLTNARCLSEGVDVPGLDSVIFFNPRNSMVDVVQSVGRVMRKAEGKDYGYIILPVAVSPGVSPAQALNDNARFKVVWQILNALRAHDDRFNAKVNSLALNEGSTEELPIVVDHLENPKDKLDKDDTRPAEDQPGEDPTHDPAQQIALFSLEKWQEAIYTKLVDKVGTRTYWEDWADDVATIAQSHIVRISKLIDGADPQLAAEFEAFVAGLRANLNDSITKDEAISMLSQHLITAPVFDALFEGHSFSEHNPVAQVMQRMMDALEAAHLDTETESLEKFYDSVRVRASEVSSASGKQQVIKELYERFFQKAFKKQADSLGIVYTPVEIVDFILRAADDVSRRHFGRGLSDEGVCILDPFAGTSTFTVRLLQSGLIRPEDLARKYANEIFVTEIMLLAYYVSAVNIETTYNALRAEAAQRGGEPEPEYVPFKNIALADTFQIHEDGDIPDLNIFRENNDTIERQKAAPINVVIGNPPYSAGQKSANDLNANLKYPSLDARIAETYAAKSTATNKNSLYDSYLRAFRWATDRIGDQGVVAFVSNGGWIDGNTGDGVRLSMAEDFTDLYVFNLRGNMRNSDWRSEGGQIFGAGSQTTIAIFVAVKDSSRKGFRLSYAQTPDAAPREEKLELISTSTVGTLEWRVIEPNVHGDWLNQRSEDFATWPVIGEKKGTSTTFFRTFSAGLQTNRDAWVYSFTSTELDLKVKQIEQNYAEALDKIQDGQSAPQLFATEPSLVDPKKSKWSSSLQSQLERRQPLRKSGSVMNSLYRPFCAQHVYFDEQLNHRRYQLPTMFPTPAHRNVGFYIPAASSAARGFNAIATELVPDLCLSGSGSGQFFPRFTWDPTEDDGGLFGRGGVDKQSFEESAYGEIGEVVEGYRRVDNITVEIKMLYREALGGDITGDDIFHFMYGKLHDPAYRNAYATDLKKMLPHIETPATREEFDRFVRAGAELLTLHIGYETVEPWPLDVKVKGDEDARETWRVAKMRWAKRKDPETGKNVNDVTSLIYNRQITISGIPEQADEYMLGSRSAVAWLIDRYQVKTDKASGIVNDPNDWADEVGNPLYIVELIGRVVRVAMETVRIVEGLDEG
ncbi:DEAD/DEAH box helicase [Corynebacterium pseudotuberculosis]|uniref:DEAD/DEAH box helicase n=1 Tax=Corynebacterium pseudotuberculosis TaxID=1719 RepID=UPI000310DEF8|nr:DEAD/DEAH box helicase [Corynebacterium pseudotuberculosis]ADK28351.2 DEAD/DEAH box helicase [Corynebacterium pseudotuberculosis FRC41]AIG06935.1 putative helicase [Corynebacterium pseudotuberculosis]AIG08483.1 putative helicase [Corynebacterium pseudotuberculosis]ALM77169.1 UvrABC system protein B [Corynebacterium pseudotuberculosis]ALU19133.1 damage-inducible protein [Corynebacterium pseudotuberculosis]